MWSSHDLTLWHRAIAALLYLVAAVILARSGQLIQLAGPAVVPLGAGAIAAAVLIGSGNSLELWSRAATRKSFSWKWGVGAAVTGGLLIALSRNSDLTEFWWTWNKGGLAAIVVGGTVLSVVLGSSHQRWGWIGVAFAAGVVPVLAAYLFTQDWVLGPRVGDLLSAFSFFAVAELARRFITDELAFRRTLIGSEGTLFEIAVAALLYGVWLALIVGSDNSVLVGVVGTIVGLSAASIYISSQSLVASGVFSATIFAGMETLTTSSEQASGSGSQPAWSVVGVVCILLAALFLYVAYRPRRNLGPIEEESP